MKSNNKIKTIMMLFLTTITLSCYSQKVDIGLFKANDQTLEVRLKPDRNFNGIISNVAFTIRWDAHSNSSLRAIQQSYQEMATIPMIKSGGMKIHDGYQYQVFAGFGMDPMKNLGAHWKINEEIVLLTIPISGKVEDFEMVNDAWTENIKNNGSFYVSLGGRNSTGEIYNTKTDHATTIEAKEKLDIKIYPNHAQSHINLTADLTIRDDYKVEIVNALGQNIYRKHLNNYQGRYKDVIDIKTFGDGIYAIRIEGAEKAYEKQIVKQ